MKEDSPQGIWNNLAEKMLIEFAKSRCGQLKSKGHGKLSIHFAAVQEPIETIFRMVVCANQLSRRCVKNMKPFTADRGDLMK